MKILSTRTAFLSLFQNKSLESIDSFTQWIYRIMISLGALITALLGLVSYVQAVNRLCLENEIFIQIQNEIVKAKNLSIDSNTLIEEFYNNASLSMQKIQSIELGNLDQPLRESNVYMESRISSEFTDRTESLKELIAHTKNSVETLLKTVAASILKFENESRRVYTDVWDDELERIEVAAKYNEERKHQRNRKVFDEILLNNNAKKTAFPKSFYEEDGWQKAGYIFDDSVVTFEQCHNLLESISLQRFVSRKDIKREIKGLNTSIYIGASDWSSAVNIFDVSLLRKSDPIVDAATFFYCNLMVVSSIANVLDTIESKMDAATSSIHDLRQRYESIENSYKNSKKNRTDTMANMVVNIVLLEIETMKKRVTMEATSIRKALELAAQKHRLEKGTQVAAVEVESLNHIASVENRLKRKVNHDRQKAENIVDIAIEITSTLHEIHSIQDMTSR